jgi:hypothetical protein
MNPEINKIIHHPVESSKATKNLFNERAIEWEKTLQPFGQLDHLIGFGSPTYQNLVNLGPEIIQLVISKMQMSDYKGILWQFVLRDVLNFNVKSDENFQYVPQEPFSMFERDRKAWLKWGAEHGYKVDEKSI